MINPRTLGLGSEESPTQKLRKIIFALRETGSMEYWQSQSLREFGDWLEVLKEARK